MNGVQVGGSQLFEMSGCWYFFLCSFWTRVLLELVVRESYMIYVILEILFASCSSRWIADRICMYLKWKWYVEKFETSPSMREQNHQQWVVGRWCQDWSGMGNKLGGEWSYTIFFCDELHEQSRTGGLYNTYNDKSDNAHIFGGLSCCMAQWQRYVAFHFIFFFHVSHGASLWW